MGSLWVNMGNYGLLWVTITYLVWMAWGPGAAIAERGTHHVAQQGFGALCPSGARARHLGGLKPPCWEISIPPNWSRRSLCTYQCVYVVPEPC